MSQKDDSENDVWDYKPLKKKKKRQSSPARNVARKSTGKARASTVQPADPAESSREPAAGRDADADARPDSSTSPTEAKSHEGAQDPSGDFCPMCQMPFRILLVQTQRWHLAECLDTPRDKCDGKDTWTTFTDSPGLESGNN